LQIFSGALFSAAALLLCASMGAAAPDDLDALREAFCSDDPPRSVGPLYWYHGEEDELVLEGIDKMHEGGMGNFTIESRPHTDYLGPDWWHDVEISLERAKELGMQVYIFDERWFPSGIAGGLVQAADPRFHRHFLKETVVSVVGPKADFACDVPEGEALAGAVAVRRGDPDREMLDLRDCVTEDGATLAWGAPDGEWDLFFYTFHSDARHHDVINIDATRKFIELTHEPTYEHFKEYFGDTIVGFFTDEPGFYNPGDQWPWTYDFAEGFEQDKGYDLCAFLPALTHADWDDYRWVRYDYMDYISRRYAVDFYKPIQDWCREHGVKSVGHLIEHNQEHWSLGAGPGHFFRAERYLDMGGIDMVFHQVLPGSRNIDYWGMPKLASSVAHIYEMDDDLAHNETYGASGWTTGLARMKWLADWQIVRGINFLVPHAFNPKWPDPDCPPFFYARGHNPQWPMFRRWADYSNRLCFMLTGGRHVAPAAVLYTAESHWAGDADPIELTEAELLKAQYDFDLVDCDLFLDDACEIDDGKLELGREEYSMLVVPPIGAAPIAVLEKIREFAESGGVVITTGRVPQHSCERGQDDRAAELTESIWGDVAARDTVSIREHSHGGKALFARHLGWFPRLLDECGIESDLTLYPRNADIRYLHRIKDGYAVLFITNESIAETYEGWASLEADGTPELWDAMAGTADRMLSYKRQGDRTLVPLRLAPYEEAMIVFGPQRDTPHVQRTNLAEVTAIEVDGEAVRVSGIAEGREHPYALVKDGGRRLYRRIWRPRPRPPTVLPDGGWTITRKGETSTGALGDWAEEDPNFSGMASYERAFRLWEQDLKGCLTVLDLGDVGELARVWVNGELAGVLICPPYELDVTDLARPGENVLRVEVTNTLANERVAEGEPVHYAEVLPSGLMGPVQLRYPPLVAIELRPSDASIPELPLPSRELPPIADTGNYACVLNGGQVAASSALGPGWPMESAIDGDRTGLGWEQGTGGWNDATMDEWPDWLAVTFDGERVVDRVVVVTLQDDYRGALEPTEHMTFTKYGIIDFDLQVEVDGEWQTVESVRGNDQVMRTVGFASMETERVRVVVHRGHAGYSRIVEIEVYGPTESAKE